MSTLAPASSLLPPGSQTSISAAFLSSSVTIYNLKQLNLEKPSLKKNHFIFFLKHHEATLS